MDRNVKVRPKTATLVLNQKGPLEKDQDIPKPDLMVVERTKVKWWNPLTWRGRQSNNNNSDFHSSMDAHNLA